MWWGRELLFVVIHTPALWDSSSAHGQVQLDVHTPIRLFGKQLGALTEECIEVVSRNIVRQFVFYTLYMVNTQSELTKVASPSL